MNTKSILCPHCGEETPVLEESAQTFCIHCGKQVEVSLDGPISDDEALALLKDTFSLLEDATAAPPDIARMFTQQSYGPSFQNYCEILYPSLELFDKVYAAHPADRDVLTVAYAEEFGGRIIKMWENLPHNEQDNGVYLYSLFALPAVSAYKSTYSDAMSDRLLDVWNRRFPKRKLQKASFEKINGGFRRRFCFVTTAVCHSLGRQDNCPELTALRRFRDDYLAKQPGGQLEIAEYYLTAPAVVAAIDASPRRGMLYRELWEKHIRKCVRLCRDGRPEDCRLAYRNMMDELRRHWL